MSLCILRKCFSNALYSAKIPYSLSHVRFCSNVSASGPPSQVARTDGATSSVDTQSTTDNLITVETGKEVGLMNPSQELVTRHVRIYQPAKNAMQSGTHGSDVWLLEFDTQERWENPLMGWCSSGDPMSNMQVQFDSAEAAMEHCHRHNWQFTVTRRPAPRPKVKSYAANFSWNSNTRRSTK